MSESKEPVCYCGALTEEACHQNLEREVEFLSGATMVRSCNRHKDCDAADQAVRAKGRFWWADHCDDEFCEDCFGS